MSDTPKTLRLWKSRPKDVNAALKRVAKLLDRPAAWTQGVWAQDCEEEVVPTLDPFACKVCLEGAVYRACNVDFLSGNDDAPFLDNMPENFDPLVNRVFKRLSKKIDKMFGFHPLASRHALYHFNDTVTREFADVVQVVKAAIGGKRVRKN